MAVLLENSTSEDPASFGEDLMQKQRIMKFLVSSLRGISLLS